MKTKQPRYLTPEQVESRITKTNQQIEDLTKKLHVLEAKIVQIFEKKFVFEKMKYAQIARCNRQISRLRARIQH